MELLSTEERPQCLFERFEVFLELVFHPPCQIFSKKHISEVHGSWLTFSESHFRILVELQFVTIVFKEHS